MGGSGETEDKRLFTHGTQSERAAKEPGPGTRLHCLLTWVIGSKPCRERKRRERDGGGEGKL